MFYNNVCEKYIRRMGNRMVLTGIGLVESVFLVESPGEE